MFKMDFWKMINLSFIRFQSIKKLKNSCYHLMTY